MNEITAEQLYRKHRGIWDHSKKFIEQNNPDLALRTYRAIRWLERAETEHALENADAAFIFYWIAFNAAYARVPEQIPEQRSERDNFERYFSKLTYMDRGNRVSRTIWRESVRPTIDYSAKMPVLSDKLSGPIVSLLNNRFAFEPFWRYSYGMPEYRNWEERFGRSKDKALRALRRRDSKIVLTALFDCLYTLRNQLMHGGATSNSSKNRDSVQDGTNIMAFLLPIFLDLMLDNPQETGWGRPHYPPT